MTAVAVQAGEFDGEVGVRGSVGLDEQLDVGEVDVPHMISWADTERDLSAWLGNAMQSNALHELYKL